MNSNNQQNFDINPLKEDEKTEFKKSFGRETIETLAAFANHKGGSVIIGISDNRDIIGIDVGKETIRKYQNQIQLSIIPSVIPDIREVKYKNKKLLIISIEEFPVKPVSVKGKYYKRIANSNHLMSLKEISDNYLQSLQLSWDSYTNLSEDLNLLDYAKIERFINKVNDVKRFYLDESPIISMEKLRFIKENKPTNAAILLFAKEFPNYKIRIGKFKNPHIIIDDIIIQDTLFESLETAYKTLLKYIAVSYIMNGTLEREEKWEYPLEVVREILINAVVHRDYSSPVDIQIKIFDDRIEFFNPGNLYGDLTIEMLENDNYYSRPRNKLISEAFYLVKLVEKYGSGFVRIREILKSYPLINFTIQEVGHGFLFVLKKTTPKTTPKTTFKTAPKTLSDKIVDYLQENPYDTKQNIADNLGISINTVKEYISKLKKEDLIERHGSSKTGYWRIK